MGATNYRTGGRSWPAGRVSETTDLDLVESLEVETVIHCFRRFTARRGVPATILSDNAKTFKAASKEIRGILRSSRLTEHFLSKGIKWKWIVELSPWKGGIWDHLIRSTKRCLVKVVGRALLSTILVEIEAVVNSRPLTYVFDDSDGISYPLTTYKRKKFGNVA